MIRIGIKKTDRMDQFSIGTEPGLSSTDHLGDMCILLAHNFPPYFRGLIFRLQKKK